MNIDDLQIVIIEDLKDFWGRTEVRELYCDLMQIKFNGYGNVYGDNVISSDKADFFGTHLIVCQKGIKLKPLFGYKSVTLKKCRKYHHTFPARSLIQKDGSKSCLSSLEERIESIQQKGENISFDYSWAQDPFLKELKTNEIKKLFQDLVMTLVVNHHKEYSIKHMLTCGVVKVKTDLFFDKMGMSKLSDESLFVQTDLNKENVHIFYANEFSTYAKNVANQYEDLWNKKLEFSHSSEKIPFRQIA